MTEETDIPGNPQVSESRRRVQRIGLVSGPLLAALTYLLLPEVHLGANGELMELSAKGRATAGIAVWMALWWLSEAIPVYATALLPLVLFPLSGATNMTDAAKPYAHPLIFLFLGGFLIARAMESHGLHRRIALLVLRFVGERPRNMIAGFMGVTAFLSMWVSNSATAIMMLPVAISVIGVVQRQLGELEDSTPETATDSRHFALAMLLGIAYGASIGGIGTPIGTPPNLFLLSYMKEQLDLEISFVRWMGVGLPLVLIFLPLTWWLLTRALFPIRLERIEGGAQLVKSAWQELGPMRRGERIVLVVFLATALAWMTRPLLGNLEIAGARPLAGLTDAGIAMLAAIVLFVIPVDWRKGRFALDWETASKVPFGVLLLFGGGLSLAAAIQSGGVAELLGGQVAALPEIPSWILVLIVVTAIVFLTELTSNTATTATLIPVLAGLAPGLGVDPLLLIVPAAIAASCAFMLPVATPPNAIVFGSGLVQISDMSRAGFWLNWIGIGIVTGLAYAVVIPLLR